MKDKEKINYRNAMLIAQTLLEMDISAYCAKNSHALAVEFNLLCQYQHEYRCVASKKPPEGLSILTWAEQVEKQLVKQTRCCVNQLTNEAKTQLFQYIDLCHQQHEFA